MFIFCQVFLQRLCKDFGITSHKHMRRAGRQQPQQVCQKIGRRGNQDSKSSSPGLVSRLKIPVAAADTADQYKTPDKNKGSCSTLSARKHKRHLLFQRYRCINAFQQKPAIQKTLHRFLYTKLPTVYYPWVTIIQDGASAQNRTVDTGIFSPLLYQLSYRGIVATRTRLELVTSAVTGRHSNQLNHRATHKKMVGANGIEPLTFCL